MNIFSYSTLIMFGLMAPFSEAASLLLDFGTGTPSGATAGVATGADAEKSPGYAAHTGESSYNYGNTATLSSLVYGDGITPATGVTVTIAAESVIGNNVINFASGPALSFSGVTGTAATSGAYSGNSPARQAVFRNGATGTQNAAMGAAITGLSAGTYSIYMVGRNTNGGATANPANFYLSVLGGSPTSFTFDGAGNTTQLTANVTHTAASLTAATFESGVSHAEFLNITIAEGETLLLATEGTGSDPRGFINSIEIVSVPEPSMALLPLASFGLIAMRRRRVA
jgi:hypothetical protein